MLFGNPSEPYDLSAVFQMLLGTENHLSAGLGFAVHFGAKRLREMDSYRLCSAQELLLSTTAFEQPSPGFHFNGIWQGVMHYSNPTLEDSCSEEMIMKFQLPFTPPGWRPDPSISPFEFTGTGVDSLGTFTIENTSLDLWRSTVYFDKVYHRSASKGGVLRHLYAGLVTPFGMGGCFNTEDEDDPLGYWFIGRPIACLDSSLHAAKKLWDQLSSAIEAKTAANISLRINKIRSAGIPRSYFLGTPINQSTNYR
jgi:hypothetical protein